MYKTMHTARCKLFTAVVNTVLDLLKQITNKFVLLKYV